MTCLEIITDVFIIIGSVGTAGSFIASFFHNRKQDNLLASLKEREIDYKFRPQLFLNSFGPSNNRYNIALENKGERLKLIGFQDKTSVGLDTVSTDSWVKVGYILESGKLMIIPLKEGVTEFSEAGEIVVTVEDPIQRVYNITISKEKGFMVISAPHEVIE